MLCFQRNKVVILVFHTKKKQTTNSIRQRNLRQFNVQLFIIIVCVVICANLFLANNRINYTLIQYIHLTQKVNITYLLGASILPYLIVQAIIQLIARYSAGYLYSLTRQGIPGQQKLSQITLVISSLLAVVLPIGYFWYLFEDWNAIIASSNVLLLDILSTIVVNILISIITKYTFCNGVSILLIIQLLLSLMLNHTIKWDNITESEALIGGCLIALIISICVYQQYTIKQLPVKNLATLDKNGQNGFLYLPTNASNVVPFIFGMMVYQYLSSTSSQLVTWIGFVLTILISNYVYAPVMLDTHLMSQNLQESNSYLVVDKKNESKTKQNNTDNVQNKPERFKTSESSQDIEQQILLAGEPTQKYLRKYVHHVALHFNIWLFIIAVCSLALNYFSRQTIDGISLSMTFMLITVLVQQLYSEFRRWIILIS